jgi:uncharacterized membrane protein YuzA (DUF378 family)
MRLLNTITLVLVILGAINWGLMGLFQLDVVATLFAGPQTTISRILYILVGLSGLYQIGHLAEAFAGEGADTTERAQTGYDRRR